MKEIVSQPTNGVICEDGKIAKNGLRVICPFCGEIGLSQGRGGSVNVWTVGAIERRKGKDLEQHIFAQLQYEVLNCKDAAKLYGIKGAPYGARDLTVSLDALVETGVQFCGGGLNV